MKRFRLPYGVSDYLPEECYQKEQLEKKLKKVFYSAGFEKVRTGALEYYELYDGVAETGNLNRMFKLTDSDGSLLVLRPDITLQISRMAVTKMGGELQKLFYIENSYEFSADSLGSSARDREFAQVGIEMIGSSGISGDIETVVLAIEALKASGLTDFLIEIGNVNFAGGILAEAGLSQSDEETLRACIGSKDALGTEMLLSKVRLSKTVSNALLQLNSLYGGAEVLLRAKLLAGNQRSKSAIANLSDIMTALTAIGYDKFVSVDLGLLKSGYYSGLVLRGLSNNMGVSILDGGRYDNLCKAFGKDSEAVGFAIGTKRLLSALALQSKRTPQVPCDVAYININGSFSLEFETVVKLRAEGKRVIQLFCADIDCLKNYCITHKIPIAIVFNQAGAEEAVL